MTKVSIRFFNDREVRAVWDDATNGWFFSVLDVVGVLNGQDDHAKNRNYWKWLKAKLKREGNQLVSATTQLRLTAADAPLPGREIIARNSLQPRATLRDNHEHEDNTYCLRRIDGTFDYARVRGSGCSIHAS